MMWCAHGYLERVCERGRGGEDVNMQDVVNARNLGSLPEFRVPT